VKEQLRVRAPARAFDEAELRASWPSCRTERDREPNLAELFAAASAVRRVDDWSRTAGHVGEPPAL